MENDARKTRRRTKRGLRYVALVDYQSLAVLVRTTSGGEECFRGPSGPLSSAFGSDSDSKHLSRVRFLSDGDVCDALSSASHPVCAPFVPSFTTRFTTRLTTRLTTRFTTDAVHVSAFSSGFGREGRRRRRRVHVASEGLRRWRN